MGLEMPENELEEFDGRVSEKIVKQVNVAM